ncbi:MAG: hypothetical protein IKF01_03085 [Bacilli bacterium]|nr:hypothetical protein [Bacilli bacterium]
MDKNLLITFENTLKELNKKISLKKDKTDIELMMLDLIEIKLNRIEKCKNEIQMKKKIGG